MKLARRSPDGTLPGLTGTARVDRRTRSLVSRLDRGDIAVIDHLDLDRATAQKLVDAEVAAVVNRSRFVSGRYPNLGPSVLAEAGVLLVDEVDPEEWSRIRDGQLIRIDDGVVYAGEEQLASGRVLDADALDEQLDSARSGMAVQLETFTHNSTEFLRREADLLLHGTGAPRLNTRVERRPVVVVVPGPDLAAELRGIRTYLREQRPVLVAVDAAADILLEAGRQPDVIVLSSPHHAEDRVSAKALRNATDVVVVVDRGEGSTPMDAMERLGVRPLRFETGATPEDAALMLAWLAGASLVIGAGVHASLDDFLDRQRAGLASTYLTRLRVGPQLVDARAVPSLYSGRVRARHVWLTLLLGLLAVGVAIAATPVGQEWWADLQPHLSDLIDQIRGLFP
ncbi:hypothetical protein EKO23_10310 [Nocardioides guangzhouensis]|uniref:SteA-like C-terminal domain-containing protein n=1 Tax=Nocardioides guangzhouensis TaxID=2497878 RepID=A0A4Q4ZFG4_9ACTN|nr:putative cytokinetic ring protein SteA [Nocardioides guangzhouensis]RYP86014.1 hypothetical protein EKO23_10310 [Nocardioides guangzhouensis]